MEGICVLIGIAAVLAFVIWMAARPGKLRLFGKDRGGTNAFTAFQEVVEPNIKHVIEAKEQKRKGAENGSPEGESQS